MPALTCVIHPQHEQTERPDHGCEQRQPLALRFRFVKTLRRPSLPDSIPFPKHCMPLPTVLSQEEVARLIDASGNLIHRAMEMTLYATGVCRDELRSLKVAGIGSERMVLHIHKGKVGRDLDLPLSPKLLASLGEYWRWLKAKTYRFPGMENNWRADVLVTTRVAWTAVTEAAKAAGITRRVSPHTFGTATRRICWKRAPIFAPSRCCSDTASWPTRRSICICRAGTCQPWPARSKRLLF